MSNKAETARVRGRNTQDVITQVVDNYHSGNGWAVKKVVSTFNNLEVYLERNAKQANDSKSDNKEVVKDVKVEASESSEKVETAVPKKTETKPVNTKAKKTSATTSNNEVKEAKKV